MNLTILCRQCTKPQLFGKFKQQIDSDFKMSLILETEKMLQRATLW